MHLENLSIQRERWGPEKGKLMGEVWFTNSQNATVKIPFGDDISRKLLEIVADQLVETAGQVAAMVSADIIDNALPSPDEISTES